MIELPPDELRSVFGATAVRAVESLRPRPHGATVGVWRVTVGESSAVLKLLRHGAAPNPNWASSTDASHPRWWRRELDTLASGTLDELRPDLRPAALLHAADRADGSLALWLEDLGAAPVWTVADLAGVAERLGRAQSRVRPELTRGFLRAYLEPRTAHLVEPFASRRDELLARLDAMPHALSHFDLHPANLFRAEGGIAVIDWAYCGSGPIGADAGVLAADAVFDECVPAEQSAALITAVRDGFCRGLGDAELAAAAAEVFAVGTALRYSWVEAWVEGRFGPPPEPRRADAARRGYAALRALAAAHL